MPLLSSLTAQHVCPSLSVLHWRPWSEAVAALGSSLICATIVARLSAQAQKYVLYRDDQKNIVLHLLEIITTAKGGITQHRTDFIWSSLWLLARMHARPWKISLTKALFREKGGPTGSRGIFNLILFDFPKYSPLIDVKKHAIDIDEWQTWTDSRGRQHKNKY